MGGFALFSSVLTDSQIDRIQETSLAILECVGVVVPHPEMLDRLACSGARVDVESRRVRIPPELIADSLARAGKSFTIYGRDLSKKAEFGVGKRNYNSTAGQALWVENPGEERRYASLQDVAIAARFADALDGINVVGAMADPSEIPFSYRCVEVLAELVRNTTKPLTFWFHDRASARHIVDLVIALRGGLAETERHPLCYPLMEPISPLRFPFNGIDLLFETARVNMPVHIGPMAQMGLSAPATLAGTMAQENAEILAGICMTQLVRPGMPICYGGICHAFDMRTTQLIFAGPEQAIFGVAMTQMAKRHGFPVYINVGMTDSKRPDAQAGLEIGMTLALGVAAGADVFGHLGISGVDQGASLDMLLLQDEAIGYVESVMREIDFSDDALGLSEIESAGPGGTFIDREHTAAHFRKELWFSKLLDRRYYQAWIEDGASSMEQRIRARKDEILRTHTPEPLPPDIDAAINEIVTEARRAAIQDVAVKGQD